MTAVVAILGSHEAVRVRFTRHAISRFVERVRPGLDEAAAARELRHLSDVATVVTQGPSWYGGSCSMWLDLGDVMFPLDVDRSDREQLVACTCLAPNTRRRSRRRSTRSN